MPGTKSKKPKTPKTESATITVSPDARKAADILAALAEPTRLRILEWIARAGSPPSVGQIAETLALPIVNVSHHLGSLKVCGLVTPERSGRHIHYALNPEVVSPSPGCAGEVRVGPVVVRIGVEG